MIRLNLFMIWFLHFLSLLSVICRYYRQNSSSRIIVVLVYTVSTFFFILSLFLHSPVGTFSPFHLRPHSLCCSFLNNFTIGSTYLYSSPHPQPSAGHSVGPHDKRHPKKYNITKRGTALYFFVLLQQIKRHPTTVRRHTSATVTLQSMNLINNKQTEQGNVCINRIRI